MKVKELVDILDSLNPNAEVFIGCEVCSHPVNTVDSDDEYVYIEHEES